MIEGHNEPPNSMEELIPGFDMKGLKMSKPGLYISPCRERDDTLASSATFARMVLDDLTGYDESDRELVAQRVQEVSRFLKGKVVIDLGAGANSTGYEIAAICGARGYVGVETNHFERLHAAIRKTSDASSSESRIPYAVVGEDIRELMRRLPDDSVCVMTFGIDQHVLFEVRDSFDEVKNHIARVLHPLGAHLSHSSVLRSRDLNHYVTLDERGGVEQMLRYQLYVKEAVKGEKVGFTYYRDMPAFTKKH